MNIVVGVSDMKVSKDPESVLVTHSLGSCIGVAVYDPIVRAGGLLHFMLPDSTLDSVKAKKTPVCLQIPEYPTFSSRSINWGVISEE